ncbi:MAG TPA: hypothetical protein VMR49_03665 [Candidatus Paceibacterota bacterium]|jgi:hypothetical protein|nr:hypothetical protein [Candidatus Paceibacterota bacterium]
MRDILTSPRTAKIKHNRRVRKLRLIAVLLVLFVGLVGVLAYYSSNPRITINKIMITGNLTINAEDIRSRVLDEISGRYLRLFAKADAFIYPRKRIYNDLIANFPRIETLSVYRDNWNTLHIAITERSGSSLYCGEEIPETEENIGENCYFVNGSGFIFDKAPYFSGNVYFKYYLKLDDGSESPVGRQMLAPERFAEISSFIAGISDLGFKPIYLLADAGGDYHLYLDHSSSDTSPEIIFKSDNDLAAILDNLSTAMDKPEFASEINSKYDKLLYIDLRFDNKVLYKFNS